MNILFAFLTHLEANICDFRFLKGSGGRAPKTKIRYRVTSHVLGMMINGLGDLKILHLGSLFAFLSHLEAKICDFNFSDSFRGVSRAPKSKLGYRVTSYVLETIINGLGDLRIIHLGSSFAFLSHQEARIYDFRLFEGFRRGFRAPNTKIGYKVTSYVLKMIKNGFGDLKLMHLGSYLPF